MSSEKYKELKWKPVTDWDSIRACWDGSSGVRMLACTALKKFDEFLADTFNRHFPCKNERMNVPLGQSEGALQKGGRHPGPGFRP